MPKRYSLSKGDCGCGLEVFYENAAKIIGVDITNDTRYDCRKICVTKPVQNYIWEHYSEEGYSDEKIAALLLQYGPKANLSGETLEFTVEDGFVTEEM